MSERMQNSHYFFFFQAEDGIRDLTVTGVQTCALPILCKILQALKLYRRSFQRLAPCQFHHHPRNPAFLGFGSFGRSEEHTSELQSQSNLVCRLLLEKKKKNTEYIS